MSARIFYSKTDLWLVLVLIGSSLLCLIASVAVVLDEGFALWPISIVTLLVGVGLPAWLFLSTRYTLTDAELLIRSGPFRWRVPLKDVQKIRKSRSLLSSPALSLDRLRIDYGRNRFVLISPREKDEFLLEIERRIEKATFKY